VLLGGASAAVADSARAQRTRAACRGLIASSRACGEGAYLDRVGNHTEAARAGWAGPAINLQGDGPLSPSRGPRHDRSPARVDCTTAIGVWPEPAGGCFWGAIAARMARAQRTKQV